MLRLRSINKGSRLDISTEAQRDAWSLWNERYRERDLGPFSNRQSIVVQEWLRSHRVTRANILDAGCGTGWMAEKLLEFGSVTGIDLADDVVARARVRVPSARFVAGSIFDLDCCRSSFDVIVCLEVLAHVADQPRFIERLAELLKPSGIMILATQNRPVLERWSMIGGPIPGQIRRWVDARELLALLEPAFDVEEICSICPVGDQGFLAASNSYKLNRLVGGILGVKRVERLKEALLLGHTLMVRARRL